MKELALVATLNNGKKILLEPNPAQGKCHYRYLTPIESEDNQLNINGNYIWLETDIHSTNERGETIVFATVEATPIVLSRF